jgi:hypothetical protein
MAAGDILTKQGSSIVFAASGGNVLITLTSLAATAGRKSDAVDLSSTFGPRYRVQLETKFGTAPTAGKPVEIYWASGYDTGSYDGGVTAGDATFTDTDLNRQLFLIGVAYADNSTNAQQQSWVFYPPSRYGVLVVYNGGDQALSSTAGDHAITLTQLIDQYQSS